jgi:hypothetical protein
MVWIFLLWIFGCFQFVSSMFCSKLLLFLNFTNSALSKKTLEAYFIKDGVLCAKEIHRLGPMDLKIYTLAKTLDCDSTADTKSVDFRQNYLCDFYLRVRLRLCSPAKKPTANTSGSSSSSCHSRSSSSSSSCRQIVPVKRKDLFKVFT